MSSPKRRRLSAASNSAALSPPLPSTRRLSHPHSQHSPPLASISTDLSATRDKGKAVKRNPLEGFDDTEDLDEEEGDSERVGDALTAAALALAEVGEDEDEAEHCAVCLSPIVNKTVISPCLHGQFCWNCIKAWSDQSRRCPLCLGAIAHLIHNIRSTNDYQTHYLLSLPSTSSSSSGPSTSSDLSNFPLIPSRRAPPPPTTLPRHALYGRAGRFGATSSNFNGEDETTWREREEERALERRKYVYREGLFAKHVASNRYTGFRPFTPQAFAGNPELKARVIKFIRRELQVFPSVDITFLTTYLVSIISQLDLRSSAAIRLISDFLTPDDAEHLAHEIVMFARSPFISLEGFDRVVQYGRPSREGVREPMEEGGKGKEEPRFAATMRGGRGPPPPPVDHLPPPAISNGGKRPLPPQEDVRRGGGGGFAGRGGRGGRQVVGDRWAPQGANRSRRYIDEKYGGPSRGGRGYDESRGGDEPSGRGNRSRERGGYDRRSRSRSRSRSRDRSYARSPPAPSTRRRSPSPPPHRLRANSSSRSPSSPPARRRSYSPHEDHRGRSPSSATLPAQASPAEPEEEKEVVSLSIFGAARKVVKPVEVEDEDGDDVVVAEPQPDVEEQREEELKQRAPEEDSDPLAELYADEYSQPRSQPQPQPNLHLSSPRPASPSSLPLPTASTASAGPPTDLRAKLAARLMAEYRTALAIKATTGTNRDKKGLAAGAQTLSLREKLEREKKLASMRTGAGAGREAGNRETVFSEETRALLLARLEEEKAFLGLGVGGGGQEDDSEGYGWVKGYGGEETWGTETRNGGAGGGGWTNTAAAEPTPSHLSHHAFDPTPTPFPALPPAPPSSETALRQLLLSKQKKSPNPSPSLPSAPTTQQQQSDLSSRSQDLKERLMKAKLMKMKGLKAGGRM